MGTLKQYIPIGSRHKLLFVSSHVKGIDFVDMGSRLAKAIEPSLSHRALPFIADEAAEKIIDCNVKHRSDIGDYIAICNIGILFEPSLRLDLRAKFSNWEDEILLQYYDFALMRV